MTKVAILPVPTQAGGFSYRAVAGEKQSEGRTPGEALDALTGQLTSEAGPMLVVVHNVGPDHFFNAAQQMRLVEMMARWRDARDCGGRLLPEEEAELQELIDAELRATADRAASMARDIES